MINIILVDDNRTLLRALMAAIPWQEEGIKIAATACDGEEAKKKLSDEIDVLVTDVRMPKADGIALTEFATSHFPRMQVVFISEYKEFDYAISALKLKVFDYIDKPIDNEKLVQTIRRAYESGREQASRAELLAHALPFMREHLLRQLLMGRNALPAKQMKMTFPQWSEDAWFTCIVFGQEEAWSDSDIWVLKARIEEKIQDAPCIVMGEAILATVWVDEEEPDKDEIDQRIGWIKSVQGSDEAVMPTCKAGISQSLQGVEFLGRLYAQAKQALEMRVFFAEQAIYVSPEIINATAQTGVQMRSVLECGTGLASIVHEERLNARFDELRKCLMSIRRNDVYHMALALLLNQYINEALGDESDTDQLLERGIEVYKKVAVASRPAAWEALRSFIIRHHQSRLATVSKKKENIIRQIYEAIEQVGFTDEGSLQRIAKEVYLSPSYVSMLFKQETGMSIRSYMNQRRLERAKQLLRDQRLKIHEIAGMVGYTNQYYFSVWFKRNTDMTPSEYREKE